MDYFPDLINPTISVGSMIQIIEDILDIKILSIVGSN